MNLRPGTRLRSAVDSTEAIVVRSPGPGSVVACGGHPMVLPGEPTASAAAADPSLRGGSVIGKRYVDAAGTAEILCTKPGTGTLTLDGEVLQVKDAKPLPASD